MTTPPKVSHFVLRFRNVHGEQYYFQKQGEFIPRLNQYLVERTTPRLDFACRFPEIEWAVRITAQCALQLATDENPVGWTILPIYV